MIPQLRSGESSSIRSDVVRRSPIAFGIVSSFERPQTVAQLVDSLGGEHPVFIHHDYTKRADFRITRPNVTFIDDWLPTGWGDWNLVRAIRRLVGAAMSETDCDYFQLLSPSCLPIKPIADFEQHVAADSADVHMDAVCLDRDVEAMMSHGFRVFAPQRSLRQRALRRMGRWFAGSDARIVERDGLAFRERSPRAQAGPMPAQARLALAAMRIARRTSVFGRGHARSSWVGSTWWGANRRACEYLLAQSETDALARHYSRSILCDESYFATVFGSHGGLRLGPSNHLISRFDDSHPTPLAMDDFDALLASPRFFARKFPADPAVPIRQAVLSHLGRSKGVFLSAVG